MNIEKQNTVSRGREGVGHGTESAESGTASAVRNGEHNANSVTKTMGLGGRWRVIALALLCIISIGSLILVSWAEWVTENRSQVSEGGKNGAWVYNSDIRVDQGENFLDAKDLYPYHNALSDTGAPIPGNDDSVVLVGIRFTVNTSAAVRYPGGLKIAITSTLSEPSCYLWRYDAAPTTTIAQVESATRTALGGYNSTNIAADLNTVLGGAVTEADGTAQSVDCDLTAAGEHDIYIYLRSENPSDAGKVFTVTLSLDETEPPEHVASAGLSFSYNESLGGYEVSMGTADPDEYEGTIYVPSMYDGSDGEWPVVKVGYYGFMSSTMTGIVLPKTVTKIGWNAFDSCISLESITIPASVSRIGIGAFYHCTSLTTVYVLSETPPALLEDDPFFDSSYLTNIYVPEDKVGDYQLTSGWSTYAEKISAIPPEA